jgi:hypothetical protein
VRRGGESRGLSAPGASAHAAPSRAEALTGAACRRRVSVPATARLVVGRRYTDLRHRASRSARAGPSSVLGILSPVKITVKGAPCGRVCDGAQTAPPLSSDLPRQDHRHLSKDGSE